MNIRKFTVIDRRQLITLVAKQDNKCLRYFLTAMLILLGWAQIWRPRTKLFTFKSDILADNTSAENSIDLELGKIVHLSIFYSSSHPLGVGNSAVLILDFDCDS